MTHRGSRIDQADYFDDVLSGSVGGIYEGGGLGAYEGIQEQVAKNGIDIKMSCRACNKEHVVTVEWHELHAIGSNGPGVAPLIPAGWQYSQNTGAVYPANIGCSGCRAPLCPQLTPDEARIRVNDAASRGLIGPQQLAAWDQMVRQHRGG